jgi:hypothetical protein
MAPLCSEEACLVIVLFSILDSHVVRPRLRCSPRGAGSRYITLRPPPNTAARLPNPTHSLPSPDGREGLPKRDETDNRRCEMLQDYSPDRRWTVRDPCRCGNGAACRMHRVSTCRACPVKNERARIVPGATLRETGRKSGNYRSDAPGTRGAIASARVFFLPMALILEAVRHAQEKRYSSGVSEIDTEELATAEDVEERQVEKPETIRGDRQPASRPRRSARPRVMTHIGSPGIRPIRRAPISSQRHGCSTALAARCPSGDGPGHGARQARLHNREACCSTGRRTHDLRPFRA